MQVADLLRKGSSHFCAAGQCPAPLPAEYPSSFPALPPTALAERAAMDAVPCRDGSRPMKNDGDDVGKVQMRPKPHFKHDFSSEFPVVGISDP